MTDHAPLTLPRAVLFDWDNTLVSNWGCVVASINAALSEFGLPIWTMEEGYERIRHSLKDSFPQIFGPDWTRARDIFYAYFEAHHIAHLTVLDGAEAMLKGLASQGVTLGVVSNKTGHLLRAEVAHLGWGPYFASVVGAGDAAADKPAPDPVHLALRPTGIAAGRDVWFVGDADIDMACAHATGCIPILVGTTPDAGGGLDRHPPYRRFDNCSAISDLVHRFGDTI